MITRLTYLRDVEPPKFSRSKAQYCEYECACGNRKVILRTSVRNGRTVSCGCARANVWDGYVSGAVAEARAKARGR